ncbi:efflux RND transporter periplasmic adaptor subunit [Chitinimonas lacunae]|uniref:Efflux RND transporter periplasmic adaptor subunit n=1 Tax=Chitinimonas lacunae TaxID=1963018 RepID=A0ABV8MR87_9NEIS
MNKHLLLVCLLASTIGQVQAHEGHDHSEIARPALSSNRPQRFSDGSVFLPKAAQRRLAVRTVMAVIGEHARTVELNGHVVMDPSTGGKVQAMLAGRIESGPKGLPLPGQAVRKGELLAWVRPAVGIAERSGQRAQQAELRSARTLAAKQLARLRELEGSVSRREIEAAEAELQSLDGRLQALSTGLDSREALIAPVDGVIASIAVVAGQVVEAKEVLLEVIDPARLLIEAQAFDASLVNNLAGASLVGSQTELRYLGGSRALRAGSLPLLFRLEKTDTALALGQPVKLIVRTRSTAKGVVLPTAAVVRNGANESIVWLHTQAERFVPRPVRATPLNGDSVLTQGIEAGARVVTEGATLLNQIR